MKIKRCELIEEIVSKEEGEESDENGIIFPKLSRLNLDCLRNLRKFYRGNLNFPSLEELSITNCYNMITLCTGTLKTNMLSEVILDGSGVLPLETNLNSTMQKEFLKKMLKEDIGFVYDGSRLQEIWDGSLQIPPDFCFSKLVKLTVGHCGFLSDAVLPFHLLPLLPKLETLKVRNCDYVKTIFDVSLGIPDFYFSKLATLIVEACPSLSDAVLSFYLLPLLPKLETLEVRNCDSVKTIFDVKCTTKHTLITFPLKKLVLCKLPKLETVWNEDPHGILCMPLLEKKVHVEVCKSLPSVFPASVAKDLLELKDLVVEECERLMVIVAEDNITDPRGTNVEIMFPCPGVRSLKLRDLPNFKYFYYCPLKSDIYKNMESHPEDQLDTEKRLSLGVNGVKMIVRGEFPRNLLHNLKVLVLCFHLDAFRYEILEQVPNVEKLMVCDGFFNEIFCCENPSNVDYYSRFLLHLKVLHLESLQDFISIGLNLAAWRLPLSNLTCLKVQGCSRLLYLLTSSTVKSLGQLKRMEIKNCRAIQEIVYKEKDELDEDEIIFPQLSCLNLDSLWNLQKFYGGSLSFPSLKEFSVTHSDKMITLCSGTLKTAKLSHVKFEEFQEAIPLKFDLNYTTRMRFLIKMLKEDIGFVYDGSRLQEIWDGSLQIPPDFCFSKLVKLTVGHCGFLSDAVLPFHLLPLLPKLETLKVRNCDYVKTIFDVSLGIPDFYFSKLATLIVEACPSLSDAVLSFYLLPLLPKLETLEVRNCDSVKTIFDVKCTTKHTLITFPLKKLVLCKLPKLETVWNEDPHGILCMPLLEKKVHVEVCKSLPSVFPASVAKDLLELKDLVVEECERLMVIVAEDNITDPRGTNVEIMFPCPGVRSLKLRDLPNFKYFYYCPLKSDIYKNMESHPEDQLDTEKRLSLGVNGVKMIVRGEFPRNLLHNLKVLVLCFHLDAFRYEILEQVPNVEKLMVCDGFFNEIFCCENPSNVDYYSRFLLHLKVLHLESLQDFISIGLNLAAWRLPLSNLTCLKVQGCSRLLYLLTSSTVKSLGQLKRMEIKNCRAIQEIVYKEKDELDEDEIIFPQLSCLNLDSLWNLQKFYGGSLSFPSLKEFSVTHSDKMITLCSGTLKTAKLSHVKFEEFQEAIPLKFDLNYTTRMRFLIKMLKEDIGFVYDGSRLQEIWDGSLQIPPDFCFSKLVKLTVGHCGFLSDAVLPFHLLPLLPKLETLKVRNCDYVKTIFDVSLGIPDFYFSKLATLIVEACPSLSDAVLSFYLLPLLPKLETLEVRNCDSVKTIFDVKCTTKHTLITFPLKKLVLCKLPKLETVWNEDPHGILCMPLLEKKVHVEVCKSLPSVFPASVAKDLLELKDLVVEECERLMVIVAEDNITDPRGTNVEIMFPCPGVRSLKLRDLPNFKYFYYCPLKSDIYKNMESHPEDQLDTEKRLSLGVNGVKMIVRGEFPRNLLHNLKVLVLCFHLDAFRYEILEQVPNVEKLMVCDGFFNEIFCCENPSNVDYYSRFLLHLKVLHLESLQDFISIGLNLAAWRLPLSNLTCLKVQGCSRLLYLLTSSTVKSLGQLKRMEIKNCRAIQEIVYKEKDELDEDEIIFPQLSCLNLDSLWNLQKFYGGSLSFPSLKEFSVTHSDKMITLCSGTLKTAKLSHVKFEEFQEAIPLKFDLNYTTRMRFLIKALITACS
ncbi:hypothetical protein DEO72_LG8g676 [Vigna unguiculata]|uniref:Disease resistance protein At4g27190-like leucine-rich repeats domain-containing protein n=1 Tax=Vigna unguiculata TaxID=3917 RepID=A0A4D6MPR9_VIGUN|nr:hypothetical protein DEO72_LG8g676 [Vigna unguiculata]